MTLREKALRYGSLMVAAFAIGAVAPVVTAGPVAAQVLPAELLDDDIGFGDNTAVNEFVSRMFPALPAGTFRGNYVVTDKLGKNYFEPFESGWLADLAAANGLSGNSAFETAFKTDPSSVKILGVRAVSGNFSILKWQPSHGSNKTGILYVNAEGDGAFDLITNYGTFRSQVWGNQVNVVAGDSSANVSAYRKGKSPRFDIPFAEFLKSANSPEAKFLWASMIEGGRLKVHQKRGLVRVWSDTNSFKIYWVAGNGMTTDGAVFTGYTQASPAGGTSSGMIM